MATTAARWMIDSAVHALHVELRARFGEEWRSQLALLNGRLAQLKFALSLLLAIGEIREAAVSAYGPSPKLHEVFDALRPDNERKRRRAENRQNRFANVMGTSRPAFSVRWPAVTYSGLVQASVILLVVLAWLLGAIALGVPIVLILSACLLLIGGFTQGMFLLGQARRSRWRVIAAARRQAYELRIARMDAGRFNDMAEPGGPIAS